ncbi:FMN-binding negative transcriptional regulator [Pseudoalteromonas sp. NEC-BIFX-2020_015]|uniref:FMN-binding negative transcriptional regulator n=1 Tax=Pseudoalteromonas sp. NEC-BIFX-2020_015 TaxID=2729544 RepID=UPI00146160A6|nr:FMN-binding negative transcriptional regulator [Pseudoalteromonas sp. NEC-BIFX-2020_015]NMR24288.1 FMN-binding negative transcriptional regulator [Pseudoalteromonas sp. NEC-BIFX-2020_015]
MYPARHFQQHDSKQLQQLVNCYPLATILMPNTQNQLNDICRVPLLFDSAREIFIGHVAKYNPLSLLDGQPVNLLFTGDDCYLSPSYSKNKTLPSWLYSSVLVTANVHIIQKLSQKESIMERLTTHFEQEFTPNENPIWQLNDVPQQHRNTMYQELSFIEFEPTSWKGNFKLSQNKATIIREEIKNSLILINKVSIANLIKTY